MRMSETGLSSFAVLISRARSDARESVATVVAEMADGGDFTTFLADIQSEVDAIDDWVVSAEGLPEGCPRLLGRRHSQGSFQPYQCVARQGWVLWRNRHFPLEPVWFEIVLPPRLEVGVQGSGPGPESLPHVCLVGCRLPPGL